MVGGFTGAKKLNLFVIPSEARNLSWIELLFTHSLQLAVSSRARTTKQFERLWRRLYRAAHPTVKPSGWPQRIDGTRRALRIRPRSPVPRLPSAVSIRAPLLAGRASGGR